MDKKLNFYLKTFGSFLIIYSLFYVSVALYLGNPSWILWFCYIGIFMIGLGMVLESPYIIAAQISVFFIPILLWDIDYLYLSIFEKPLLGITNFMFHQPLISIIANAQHLFVLPIGLYALYRLKITGKTFWILGLVEMISIFILTRLLTSAKENVNCVYYSCVVAVNFHLPFIVEWFIIAFVLVFVSSFIITRIPWFYDRHVIEVS